MIKINFRRLMADRKIDDISDVMKMTGMHRNTITKLYREIDVTSIKLETLIVICDALGCKLSELIEYIPDSKDQQ